MSKEEIIKIIKNALDEDLGKSGDVTSNLTIAQNKKIKFQIKNRQKMVLCGVDVALEVFELVVRHQASGVSIEKRFGDGEFLEVGSVILEGEGDARSVFAAERVALNFLQHLSGIASKTREYVEALDNSKIKILDSRKTIPGLRILQKYAVKIGGGQNHRFGLYDAILIKDNHIAAAGGVKEAVVACKNSGMKIEVECDNLDQVKEAAEAGADIIMLDNMNLEQIQAAIKIINKKAKIEVSGGINLAKIKSLSNLEIDFISIGALTHSTNAIDIGLDIIN